MKAVPHPNMPMAVFLMVMACTVSDVESQIVNFYNGSVTTKEGEQFTVYVQLTGEISQTIRVIAEIQGDVDNDFIGDTQVATFTPTSKTASVIFTVRDDDKPEDREMFYLRLYLIDFSIFLGNPNIINVTIEASDDAYGVFGFLDSSPMIVKETLYTSIVSLRIGRSVSYFGAIGITFIVNTTAGSANGSSNLDIGPVLGTVTFQPQQREAILQLQILPDGEPENDESFPVQLTYATYDARINNSVLELIIASNDAPVRFSQATYRFEESPGNKSVSINVLRGLNMDGTAIGPTNGEVVITYKFESGTALLGNDVSTSDGQLIFRAGETVKPVAFVISDDTFPEVDESFRVFLSLFSGDAALKTPYIADIIIAANDYPGGVITFQPSSGSQNQASVVLVNEDTYSVANFTVLRNEGTFGEVSVSWKVIRSNNRPEPVEQDVGPPSGELLFRDGENQQVIQLVIVQDSLPEPAEQFDVVLSRNNRTSSAAVQGITTAKFIIEDSDNVYGTVEFGPDTNHRIITTMQPRKLRLSVTRSGGRLEDLQVNVSVSYIENDIWALPGNIFSNWEMIATLLAGQDPTLIDINILPSAFLTTNGRFIGHLTDVWLSTIPEYGIYNSPTLGTRQQVILSVTESEANGESGFNSTASFVVKEPTSGTLEIPLLIVREGKSGTATIRWSVTGVGTSAGTVNEQDVRPFGGTVDILADSFSVDLLIYILADDIPETDETFVVKLESIEPSASQRLRQGSKEIYITILANGNPGGVFQFSRSMPSNYVIEEGTQPVEVVVERTGGDLTTERVQFDIRPNGTADFFGTPSVLIFEPSRHLVSSTILAKSDGIPELNETFTLVLTALGNATLGERTSISITVLENDFPYGRIQFLTDPTMVFTGETTGGGQPANISLAIKRDRGTYGEVTAPWELRPGTGDLSPTAGIIVFKPGQFSYSLGLQVTDDNIPEQEETFVVQLGKPTGGAVQGIPVSATIIILENDMPITFAESVVYAEEPSTVQLTVQRSGKLDAAVTMSYHTLDGSASSFDKDYQEIPSQSLELKAGEANKTISVTVLDDLLPEGNETFIVELYNVLGDFLLTNKSRATVVILANDDAYGVFSFSPPVNNKVEEGSTIFIDIVRSRGRFGMVGVSWELHTLQNITVVPGSDFNVTQGTVVFQEQESRSSLAVSPIVDLEPEQQETFRIVLTGVTVLTGLTGKVLARLDDTNIQTEVVIPANDDPNGVFAFPAASKDLIVAEDFYPGNEASTETNFTVERRQGTEGTVQVLWHIFSEPFATNLPLIYELLFTGQRPSAMLVGPEKQREGTGTIVLQFSGTPGSFVTVPSLSEPTSEALQQGFTISAWIQPINLSQGYIVARSSTDGNTQHYSVRLVATPVSTMLEMTITSASSTSGEVSQAFTNTVVQDGRWHHVLVAVGYRFLQFYLDGNVINSSSLASGIPLLGPGVLLVGARAPGREFFVGYLQDVIIWTRTFDSSDVANVYATPPLSDVTPVSGVLTYADGTRMSTFKVHSKEDIEEEGDEVFTIVLVAATGGASLSVLDSHTTLTVLKSDNANGLFGLQAPCSPARVENEGAFITCNVTRLRGDDGTVTVVWLVKQLTANGSVTAAEDFVNFTGSMIFAPGERFKSFQAQVRDDTLPELDEQFQVSLESATSDDGLVGSTNTSGASIDPVTQRSSVTVVQNDFPYGLLQFSSTACQPPLVSSEGFIEPASKVPTVFVGEETGTVCLVVERAQGLLGSVSAEWRTIDRTAVSQGKTPPDYVLSGAVGRLTFASGQNFAFVNITVVDNPIPEAPKTFEVELINPTGGAALGAAKSAMVTINASDNAFGQYQFADDSLAIMAQELGDVGYTSAFLRVLRVGGTIGADTVTWQASENEDDGLDLMERTGYVTFAAGQTTANLEIRVRSDTQPELDEVVVIHLTQVAQGALGDNLRRSASVTIEANDDPYGYFVIIDSQRPVRTEESAGSVNITIWRMYGKFGTVSVGYQTLSTLETYSYLPSPVTRADYQDFTPVSNNVSFVPGQEYGFFSVPILDDTVPEQDETIFVRLTTVVLNQAAQLRQVPNSPRLGSSAESYAQIIINSNDNAAGVLELSPTMLNVTEETEVPQLRVVRSGGTFGEVTVQFRAIEGGALSMYDFVLTSNQVVLGSGETSKLLPIVIVNDVVPEVSESFTIELLDQVTGGPRIGLARSAVITILPSDDPNGVFEFASTGITVQEPENGMPYPVSMTVVRTGGSMDVVTVQWMATLNGAPLLTDISPTSGSLFFVSNEASRTITVSVLPDDLPEGTEDITITLISASNSARTGEHHTFVLSIPANDNPYGTVEFASSSYSVQEVARLQVVPLTRSGGTFGPLRVYYSTAMVDTVMEATQDGTAVLSYFTGPVSAQRATAGTAVNVNTAGNKLWACSSACLGTEACLSFHFGSTQDGFLCVWFSDIAPESELISVANMSYFLKNTEMVQRVLSRLARAGEDYNTVTDGFIMIQDGNNTGFIPVSIIDDVKPELDEKFLVQLLRVEVDGPGVTTAGLPQLGKLSSATVTILTNDNAYGAFSIYSDSPSANREGKKLFVEEQNRLAVDLFVAREGGSLGEVSVRWEVNMSGNTATYGSDFIADGATLTFSPGQTRRAVTVTILDDSLPEVDENFTIQLSDPRGGATLSTYDHMTIVILANDNVAGIFGFNTTSVLANEGDRISVGVQRALSQSGTVVVNWAVQNISGSSPQLVFQATTGNFTFLPGQVQKTVELPVLSSDTPKLSKEYQLTLTNVSTSGLSSTGAAAISPQFGTVHITIAGSNDPHGVFQFATSSLAVVTAEDVNVTLQVIRKFGAFGTVRLAYQVIQGILSPLTPDLNLASPGQDFVATNNSFVDVADGFTSASIPITIIDDLLPEIDEVFLVKLLSVILVGSVDEMSPPRLSSEGTTAEVKISANDGVQGVIMFATDSRSVIVDEVSPTISLSIMRMQGTYGEVSVMYYSQSISDGAVTGTDYILVPGELVFAPGVSQKNIIITIVDDKVPEPDEQFEVILTSPRNGATLGQFSRATVTILANDGAVGEVNFDNSSIRVTLREATLNNQTGSKTDVTIRRGPGIYGRITVPFIITTPLDMLTSDITPASGIIIFDDRQNMAVVELSAVDDSEPETAEEFIMKLQTPSNGAVLGAVSTATITVAASDSPYGLFEIFPINSNSSASQNVQESVGTVYMDVIRSKGLLGRVSVDMLTTPGTATFQSSSSKIVLAEIQTVPAVRISGWCKISAGDSTYILMITSLNANEHLRLLLGETTLLDGQSVLYRWQGELTYIRTLPSDGAQAATSFTIANITYFVIANSGKQGARGVQSIVYKLRADGAVEVVQGLTTYGATDVRYFMANDQHYLVFANSMDDTSRSNISSFVYRWDSALQRFGTSATHLLPTLYAKAIEVFTISGILYLAVANYYDATTGSYETDSVVYRQGTDGSFVQLQRLATAGAVGVEHVAINNAHYLIVANSRKNVVSSMQTSWVYRWDAEAGVFLQHQDLQTSGIQHIATLTLSDSTVLLALANSLGSSEVMQWNVSQSHFVAAWSGDPYPLLQPITIQQTTGSLPMLAAANMPAESNATLFQIAQISPQSDFVPRRLTLTFEPGQTKLQATVVILPDDVPEDVESFSANLVSPTSGAEIGSHASVTINILANDNAHGIIQFAADSLNLVTEEKPGMDNTIQLNVVRQGGFFGQVTVQWVATGDHSGMNDISPLSGTVEFANGQSVATISLTVRDDNIPETAETTYVRLTQIINYGTSSPSEGARLGDTTLATVTVSPSDSPYGVVSWQTTSMATPEPESTDAIVSLTVIREQGLQGQLRVSYVTSMALDLPPEHQATSGQDFVSTQGSVLLPVNATRAVVQIVVKQDSIPETSESFYVNLTAVEVIGLGNDNSGRPSIKVPGNVATITILENDNARGMIQFDVTTNVEGRVDTYEEYGRNNTISLQLRRSVGYYGNVTVTWQAEPSTATILDFSPASGTITFVNGQQTATIDIIIIDDQIPENMEMFGVKLIGVSGDALLGSVTSVRVAILKNDSPSGFFRFGIREVKIREPQAAGDPQSRAVLIIQRVQGAQGLVNIQWRLNAAAQDDFIPPLEGTVQFMQGEIEKNLIVEAKADGILEGEESFVVSLVSADNNADISPAEGDATIIIAADPGASGTVSILVSSRYVLIGEPGEYRASYNGTANVVLTRASGIYGQVVVTWALTPRNAAAFVQLEGTVTFLDLQQTAVIVLQARDDSDPELRLSYLLQITSASGGAILSPETGATTAEIVYIASDFPHGLFEFALPETVSISEDMTSVEAAVRRNKGTVGQVQVYYTTTPGTATSGQDFYPASGVLVFENGVDSQVVQVSVIQDSVPEGPEDFFINITSITLLSPTNNNYTVVNGLQPDMPPAIGPVSSKRIIIEKNDNAEGIIEFDTAGLDYKVQEEAGMAQIPVIRHVGSYGIVAVSYATQPITATAGIDYVPAYGVLQLASGQGKAVINVTLIDDTLREFEEQFSVTLSSPTGGVVLGSARTSIVTILKSDYPNGKFGFLGETQRSIPNPSSLLSVVFYIERTEGLLGQQQVQWRIMGPNSPSLPLGDTSDISYSSSGVETTSGSLSWADGEAGSKQFTLNIKPYTSWEIQKTFVIMISDIQATPPTVGSGEISPTSGKVFFTIQKYGDPNGIIEFSGVALTVREVEEPSGADQVELGFPVVRQTGTGTQGNVMVYWEVHGPGTEVTDVRPANGSLLLPDGLRQGQVILQVLPDDIPELTEVFALVLMSVEGGAEINKQASISTFRIRFNDDPHGQFGVRPLDQRVTVDTVDLSRSLSLNFTRYFGTFGSVILTYKVAYDEALAGVGLSASTGTVTFGNAQSNALASVPIQGSGFLKLGTTFSVTLVDVQFLGDGVTQPPQLKAGETDAKVAVSSQAANSEVSFSSSVLNIIDESGTAVVTIVRQGAYGSLSVEWNAGEPVGSQVSGVTNGEIIPLSGIISIAHGVESKNFTVQVNAKLGQVETFVLRLPRVPETPVSGGARLASSNLKMTLDPSGALRFMPSSLSPSVSELDGKVTVTVVRAYGAQSRIEVTYNTEDGTAKGDSDFRTVNSDTVIIEALQSTANITIPVFKDTIPEPSEQFNIRLLKVDVLPTPTQPGPSPRLDIAHSTAVVTITESNDPCGVLSLDPFTTTVPEIFSTVSVKVKRTGGLFGTIGVTVRTVGGGESWTSDIVASTDNTTADTISQALGQRDSSRVATGGVDYEVLDTIVSFQAGEAEKMVTLVILDDSLPEPAETVLVYLTSVTGGARVARGTSDGGVKGYAIVVIEPSDTSNGVIGFSENSKNVEADEDANPIVRLTLTRLNAFFGDVRVTWKAKVAMNSSDTEDAQLTSQLVGIAGVTTCAAGSSLCYLDVALINDTIPEESFSFIVKLERVDPDAQLNQASLYASIKVLPSDDVRGLVQFTRDSRLKVIGESAATVRVGVERVQGLDYEVQVGYHTMQMQLADVGGSVTIYPALDGQDFTGQLGTLVFKPRSQEVQYIDVKLTPLLASSNPFPKQFFIQLYSPSNQARLSPDYNTSKVLVVQQQELPTWSVITAQLQEPLNNTNILRMVSQLGIQAQSPLSDDQVTLIDDMLKAINEEGSKRQLPADILDATFALYCKLVDPGKTDATAGRHAMAQTLENFSYIMLTQHSCPDPLPKNMLSRSCAFAFVAAARWPADSLMGFTYEAYFRKEDRFNVPTELTVLASVDGTDDQCVDFHVIEYNSGHWFPTQNGEQLLSGKVFSFGVKGRPSGDTASPVSFTVHTQDRRVAAKRAQCVYFDTASQRWVSPLGVCQVINNLDAATDDFVTCSCSHMTSYAVIAEVYDAGIVGYTVWFYVACFICMGCLAVEIVTHHLCFGNPTFAACLLQHFFFSILVTQMCLVIDTYLSPEEILTPTTSYDNYRCIVMGIFLHYFFLAQFTWIMTQAVNYWKTLVMNDEHTRRKYTIFFLLGWGLPMAVLAIFYAVAYNVYKYKTSLPVDYIYGDVNNNGDVCFITNAYAAIGGIIGPVLLLLLVPCVVFVKAFQLLPQWQAYDDVYHCHYNATEIRLLLVIWCLATLMWLWGGLHMVYGQLWMLVLYCICSIVLGLLVFVLYAILRNPRLKRFVPGQVTSPAPRYTDMDFLPPVSVQHQGNMHVSMASIKGSRSSLINEAWEQASPVKQGEMTVRRALPSQVYVNPPFTTISSTTTSILDPQDFDDILHALKTRQSYTPSEISRSVAEDDGSPFSSKLDLHDKDTKRIDIADTHV